MTATQPQSPAQGWARGEFQVAYVSDPGLVRTSNQDRVFVAGAERIDHPAGLLLAVADGMGGHQGGETASETLVEVLATHYDSSDPTQALDGVKKLLLDANRKLYRMSRSDPDLQGIGTTLTAAIVTQGLKIQVLQVGDSRAYRRRGQGLTQVTIDHSFVNDELRKGNITPEEAENHPKRNVITRAVGTRPYLDIDTYEIELEPEDDFLLCSDGLHGMLDDSRLLDVLRRDLTATEAVRELVNEAYACGARDNIGIVLVRKKPQSGLFRRLMALFSRS